jgi:diguanylate cyclase (GGDEF)-like protein/PAS domain S-box-containing protein
VGTVGDVSDEGSGEPSLADSEALLRVVLDSTSDAVMRFDPNLRVEYVNRRLVENSGISAQDWLGKTFAEAGYPPELTVPWDEFSRVVFATGEPVLHEFNVDLPGGRRWFETRIDPEFDADGVVAHVITTSRDVTERKFAEARLHDSEALMAVAVEGSRDPTATYGPDLRIEYVNRSAAELSGIPAEAWIGKSMAELGYPESSVALWTARIGTVFGTGEPESMQYEVDNTAGHRWYEANLSPLFGPDGSVAHVMSTSRDITERVVAEQSLRDMATHDALTGLANRPALLDDIDRGLRAAGRTASTTAVLLIDLDRFKIVNDSLGHDVGDTLLRVAAQRLAGTVRGGDLVGRLGGDEFVVVMRDLANPAEAVRAAWRLVQAFRRPFSTPAGELFSTASIGVAISRAESEPADLLREADTAMYAAKDEGRDRVAVFNDQLRDTVAARLAIEGDLRHALERDQLAVWFQPEIDLVTGRVTAAEALLRWHHPSGQTLTAARFIDVAEETGLINDIGDWVLMQTCVQAASWATSDHGDPITVRVNVSARQLAEGGLLTALDDALSTSRLDPGRLCLEITETALLGETTIVRDNLTGIHARGVHIAVDDFGTGYASLTYLHRYPIDVLKIDRSFITGITASNRDYRLVGALIAMADHLQLSVTAEGVEHETQADCLRALRCPGAQGYLYSPAVPPEQISTILDTVYPHP